MTAVATAPRHAAVRGGSSTVTGLGVTMRIAWRRSRLFWIIWVLCLWSLLPATVSKYHEIVPDGPAGQATLDMLASNVTMRALLGQPYDLGNPGGFTFWRVGVFTAAAAGMMAGLGIVRSTRGEEEEGRTELIRSGAVGRHAPLLGAILVALLACLTLGVLTAGTLTAMGLPLAGSVASGLSLATTGAMFVGVGAVFAQVFSTSRSANAWTLGVVLGGLYVARALVDAAGDNLPAQWFMPMDWAGLARPYAGERWWVYALPTAVTALLVWLAFALENHRDLGSGLVAPRPGRATAARSLSGAQGLALRLQRGGLWGWGVGIAVSAVGVGSLSQSMDKFTGGNVNVEEMFRKMGGGSGQMLDEFYQAMIAILVAIIAFMGAIMLQRLRSEETHGHAEVMLSTATSRLRFAWSHLSIALVATTVLMLATGPLLGLVQYGQDHDAGHLWMLFKASAVMWPGIVLVLGLAMFLHGWAPRLLWIVWGVLGWTIFVSWIGALLDLPSWATKLQPFARLPHLPMESFSWTWVALETAIGLLLLVLGLVGYRRRDIQG